MYIVLSLAKRLRGTMHFKQATSLFLLLLWPAILSAAEFQGTKGVALSGALRGSPTLNEGIYHNAASFAYSQRYSIEAYSSVLPAHDEETEATWIYGGSVVDAHSPLFSAGLSYYRKFKKQDGDSKSENAFHGAISKVFSETVSLGGTGKVISRSAAGVSDNFFDFDLGTFLVLTPTLQLGVVVHNLLAADPNFIRQGAIGGRLKIWQFAYLNTDIVKDTVGGLSENIALKTALELVHRNGVSVQLGLSMSDKDVENLYSLGAGWAEHKLGLHYAFQNSMDGLGRKNHSLSLRIFF
jgi:hypothetical protein